ncbi:MAG: hypothetical protein KTR25_10765 [Myxococcales bacterium]|nr:hypothetical protein [Myxococcales bacterium]
MSLTAEVIDNGSLIYLSVLLRGMLTITSMLTSQGGSSLDEYLDASEVQQTLREVL